MRFLFAFLSMCILLNGEESSLIAKTAIEDSQMPRKMPTLKGIVLLPSREGINQPGYDSISGVEIIGVDVPDGEEYLKFLLQDRFIGQPLSKEQIAEIKREIVSYYRQHERPIVTVITPKQDISAGVLQLIVVEGKVGSVEVHGNRYFATKRLKRYLNAKPGDVIRSDVINKDLTFINKNPFRQADLIYKPGQAVGTTDLELIVQDRRTYRLFAGMDNTGNSITGNNRYFAGFNWGNVFNLDHVFTFQFSASGNFKEFLSYTAHYMIPLPTHHTMTLYGGYSSVDAKFDAVEEADSLFHNHGYTAQASFRYDMPFKPIYSYLQELTFGFDFKRMNNNLEFGGSPVFSKNVDLFQFMASYNMGYETKKLVTTFEIEGFYSPFRWLPDQSNANYHTLRPFSKDIYLYARSSFSLIYHFHEWVYYSIFLRGQAATTNLLPSEEYGVGGYDTVRGYQEREANGDFAVVGNFELVSRPFAFSRCFNIRDGGDQMQLLGFFDYGAAYLYKADTDQKKNQHLYSFGPGIRYQVRSNFTARLDWGFQLHRITPNTPQQRLHFQMIASY